MAHLEVVLLLLFFFNRKNEMHIKSIIIYLVSTSETNSSCGFQFCGGKQNIVFVVSRPAVESGVNLLKANSRFTPDVGCLKHLKTVFDVESPKATVYAHVVPNIIT